MKPRTSTKTGPTKTGLGTLLFVGGLGLTSLSLKRQRDQARAENATLRRMFAFKTGELRALQARNDDERVSMRAENDELRAALQRCEAERDARETELTSMRATLAARDAELGRRTGWVIGELIHALGRL